MDTPMPLENDFEFTKGDKQFIGWHMVIAIFALAFGSLFGPLQAMQHAGWFDYAWLQPLFQSYYQGLTLHGVLNALVWTTFFIVGFFNLTISYGLKMRQRYPMLNLVGFIIMVVGLVTTAIPILLDEASVLFTFYPPLLADPLFYIGLTLVVVGSWVEGWGMFATLFVWRKANPGQHTPLMALASVITMALWQVATIGIAVEMLTMLIPASLSLWDINIVAGMDPQLARTYFWFTGHPLVYFWLLPAYVSWYTMLPKQVGGKLFSEPLARLSFWLFLLLSVPLGFHHQYLDPGVPIVWKYIHGLLTYSVFLPSMLTAFTVIASLEQAGRKKGGPGLVKWLMHLNWWNPSVSAQLLAGILFMFGGISGLTNASYNLNLVVHNTTWVPGHFHLTVATAVTLSFIGISYWLVPYLTGKRLWQPRLAVIQTWLWFVGMAIFSNAMHVLGLLGAPRRVPLGIAPYVPPEWAGRLIQVGIGGIILFFAVYIYVLIMVMTSLSKQKVTQSDEELATIPMADTNQPVALTPRWLDNWTPWLVGTIALILIAYGPSLFVQISNMQFIPGRPGLW